MLAVWAWAASPGSAPTAASDRQGPCPVPHWAFVEGLRLPRAPGGLGAQLPTLLRPSGMVSQAGSDLQV